MAPEKPFRLSDPRRVTSRSTSPRRSGHPGMANAADITEMQRIIAIAKTTGAAPAPYCAIGEAALAAPVQLGFASTQDVIQGDRQASAERGVL